MCVCVCVSRVRYLGYISLKGNERHGLPVKMKVCGHFTTAGGLCDRGLTGVMNANQKTERTNDWKEMMEKQETTINRSLDNVK